MSKTFLKTAAFALVIAAVTSLGALTARADANAPVCARTYSEGGGTTQCDFATYAQCMATISGRGGSCSDNPYLGPRMPVRADGRVRRR
jgi:hypothetical protein